MPLPDWASPEQPPCHLSAEMGKHSDTQKKMGGREQCRAVWGRRARVMELQIPPMESSVTGGKKLSLDSPVYLRPRGGLVCMHPTPTHHETAARW